MQSYTIVTKMHDLKTGQKNMGLILSGDEIGTNFCIDNEFYYLISKSLNMYNSIYYGYTVTG